MRPWTPNTSSRTLETYCKSLRVLQTIQQTSIPLTFIPGFRDSDTPSTSWPAGLAYNCSEHSPIYSQCTYYLSASKPRGQVQGLPLHVLRTAFWFKFACIRACPNLFSKTPCLLDGPPKDRWRLDLDSRCLR